ncbi:unnamed protein product [Adineta steineri]|uniref:SGNH hydrolase-type esterase domain-containing protein n=1 Tax=Adineta steineri TaxID=433720 RepID=A0A815GNI8_9BILA|nr:unnamed protein product [Adineta steineri]CAF4220660.1 unnamed protein product [Adineta steineri]
MNINGFEVASFLLLPSVFPDNIMLALFFTFVAFNLIVVSQQQSDKFLIAFGDSFTSGGWESYPLVAGRLLNWPAHNFAQYGSQMSHIPIQLSLAGNALTNATHVVFTTSGNDLGVEEAIQQIAIYNNYAAVANKVISLKPQLIWTYQIIKGAVRAGTKIYALPYVDFISVGDKIPNEADGHRLMDLYSNTIKAASQEAGIGFIEPVKSAFAGHEMYSADPYVLGFDEPNAAHPNEKGFYKIGEVVADYIKSH